MIGSRRGGRKIARRVELSLGKVAEERGQRNRLVYRRGKKSRGGATAWAVCGEGPAQLFKIVGSAGKPIGDLSGLRILFLGRKLNAGRRERAAGEAEAVDRLNQRKLTIRPVVVNTQRL